MSYSSHLPSFYRPNNIWRWVQVVKLLVIQLSPPSCTSYPFGSNNSLSALSLCYSLGCETSVHIHKTKRYSYFDVWFSDRGGEDTALPELNSLKHVYTYRLFNRDSAFCPQQYTYILKLHAEAVHKDIMLTADMSMTAVNMTPLARSRQIFANDRTNRQMSDGSKNLVLAPNGA